MKKRLAGAGVLVVVVGIVAGRMGMFPGLGNGSGSNAKTQVNVGSENQTPPNPEKSDPADAKPENAAHTESSTNVLDVLIENRSYKVRQLNNGKEEYVPIDLPELISLAKKTEGNEDGIRVRISRHETSRRNTEKLLGDELIKAGLSRNAVQWQEGLLP